MSLLHAESDFIDKMLLAFSNFPYLCCFDGFITYQGERIHETQAITISSLVLGKSLHLCEDPFKRDTDTCRPNEQMWIVSNEETDLNEFCKVYKKAE